MQIWKQVLIWIRARFFTTWRRLANLAAFRGTFVLIGDDLLWCRFSWTHTTRFIFRIVLLTIFIKINTKSPIFFHINSEIGQFMLTNAFNCLFLRTFIICFADQIIYITSSLPHLILKLYVSHVFIGLWAMVASGFLSLFSFLYFNYFLVWHNNFEYTWIKWRFFLLFWLLAGGCNFRWFIAVCIIEARNCVFASERVEIVIFVLLVHYNILIRCCRIDRNNFLELIISRSRGFVAASFVFAFFLIIFYFSELLLQSFLINFLNLLFFCLHFLWSSGAK